MDKQSRRKITAILQILENRNEPVGSTLIASLMQEKGYDLSDRTVRYYLQLMDYDGLTENLGKKGRVITGRGIEEFKAANVIEKVGFIESKIDALSYQVNFSIKKKSGKIILNLSTFDREHFNRSIETIKSVFRAGLSMGQYLKIIEPEGKIGSIRIPRGKIGIATVCSITINGILLKKGIYPSSRFAGVLEISGGRPLRFTDIINYSGTTIDPLEIFIKGGMTNVSRAVKTGNGKIGASFREIPSPAYSRAIKIKELLDANGLNGILMIGRPGQPLLDIPVAEGRAGMIVAGGLNPLAAVEEDGISTKNTALKLICDFSEMEHYEDVIYGR